MPAYPAGFGAAAGMGGTLSIDGMDETAAGVLPSESISVEPVAVSGAGTAFTPPLPVSPKENKSFDAPLDAGAGAADPNIESMLKPSDDAGAG